MEEHVSYACGGDLFVILLVLGKRSVSGGNETAHHADTIFCLREAF